MECVDTIRIQNFSMSSFVAKVRLLRHWGKELSTKLGEFCEVLRRSERIRSICFLKGTLLI